MRLVVTGAAGMLGHRVVDVARERGHDVVATDIDDLDLLDAAAVERRFGEWAPEAVIHCAAFTDVDGAEDKEELATRVNGEAAGNVARHAPYVVAVSTDYVFAGDARDTPYLEDDEPAPKTAYGRSKLAGEHAVAAAGAQHAICRTAWLYGAGGKNFVDTMLRLAGDRDELRVVGDQVGSPTWTGHLAPALVEVAERRLGGIHHLTGDGQCSWADLARATFEEAGVSCRVTDIPTSEYPMPTPRPAYSVLGQGRSDTVAMPPWRDGLRGHLSERKVATS
jgi:dTDP-4-dehydrorhamnose reductase